MPDETVSTTCAWVAVALASLVFAGSDNAPLACRRIQYLWNLCLRWAGLGSQAVVGKLGAESENRADKDAEVPTAEDWAKIVRLAEEVRGVAQADNGRTQEQISELEQARQRTPERMDRLEEAHQRALERIGRLEEAHQRALDRIHGLSPQWRARSDRKPFRLTDKSLSPK